MIREALPEDFGAVMRLYRQLHPGDPALDNGSDRDVFDAILATRGLTLLVLEIDGVVVATTYLNIIPNITRNASPYAVIENVVVDESVRGTGLGKQIMAKTLRVAWTRAATRRCSSRAPRRRRRMPSTAVAASRLTRRRPTSLARDRGIFDPWRSPAVGWLPSTT